MINYEFRYNILQQTKNNSFVYMYKSQQYIYVYSKMVLLQTAKTQMKCRTTCNMRSAKLWHIYLDKIRNTENSVGVPNLQNQYTRLFRIQRNYQSYQYSC